MFAQCIISTPGVVSALLRALGQTSPFPWCTSFTLLASTPPTTRPTSSLSLLLCRVNEGSREGVPPGVPEGHPLRLLPPGLPPGLWHLGQPIHPRFRTLLQLNHFLASFSLSFHLGTLQKTSLLCADLAIMRNRPPSPMQGCSSGIILITYMTWCSN